MKLIDPNYHSSALPSVAWDPYGKCLPVAWRVHWHSMASPKYMERFAQPYKVVQATTNETAGFRRIIT